jgi:hypothetical protein
MTGDARTHAALAVEQALGEADRQRILDRFRHGNLNGADVADILDILGDHDELLELREPFYDNGADQQVRELLDWQAPGEGSLDYVGRLRYRLISYSCLAVALLTDAVPTPGPVARLAGAAAAVAAERWPGGEYVR